MFEARGRGHANRKILGRRGRRGGRGGGLWRRTIPRLTVAHPNLTHNPAREHAAGGGQQSGLERLACTFSGASKGRGSGSLHSSGTRARRSKSSNRLAANLCALSS